MGEADHPGPTELQETLIDSLEFDLTRLDPDVGTGGPTQLESGADLFLYDSVEVEFDRSVQSAGGGLTDAMPTDVESDTESLDDNPMIRRRLTLNWISTGEQEVLDSHDQRLARVRRQLQRDRSAEQPAPAQVVAMDVDGSSDGHCIHDNRQPGRHRRGHGPANNLSVSVPQSSALNQGFRSLDCLNLVDVFEVRPLVMKTIAFLLRGAFKTALRASCKRFDEVKRVGIARQRSAVGSSSSCSRGFCCTDHREGSSFQRSSCKNESTSSCKGIGFQCWRHLSNCLCKEQQRVADAEEARQTQLKGGPDARSTSHNLGSCLRHDRF